MVPRTFPSSFSRGFGRMQMRVRFLTSVVGMQRWTDYIPVKLVEGSTSRENEYANTGFVSVDIAPVSSTDVAFKDYVPVYVDNAATVPWQVSANGYIPYSYSGFAGASLVLDFTNNAPLDSRITFTRASAGTYFDSTGTLQSAGNNVARFTYNPVTLEPQGLLIEEQRTNLLLRSAEFDNASWTKSATVTVTANTSIAPDGTTTADTITADSGLGVYQTVTVSIGNAVTQSVFIKAGTASLVMFRDDTGVGRHIVVNPTTGVITATNGTLLASSSTSVGNGWWRISFSYTADTTSARGFIRPESAGSGQTIIVWGAQTEIGAFATSYIPTVAAQVTRSADSASMTGTNFSSWYNASEGTLYAEFAFPQAYSTATSAAFAVDAGTANNELVLRTNTAHTSFGYTAAMNGVVITNVGNVALGTMSAGVFGKSAIAFKSGDSIAVANGTLGTASTTAFAAGALTTARIGNNRAFNQPLNGTVKKIAYYPIRNTNAQVQALTTV